MAEADYYELIGVDRGATLAEIRSKFRQKVLAEHPDKGGDPAKFQLLNKAYNVLTDVDKRKRYDQTGRTEMSAEEEFARSFGGGRHQERSKDADREAVVNIENKVNRGAAGEHEEGFNEWLRQRDQSEMVMTDKDFMKNALFSAVELTTKINHTGTVHHVLGSPKTDAYGQPLGGQVQVSAKPKSLKKTIDHNELLVRMLSVPVDDSMIYAELNKTGVCLGMTGVGVIEQVGQRIEDFREDEKVLILPKPAKYTSQRPLGTARTLLICEEDDVIAINPEVLEELTPEQICLAPAIVTAYTLLEQYGAKLKPGDSVLLNAAHLSATGSALLQLCKLLKLKPLCLLQLAGSPKNLVKGEYHSKSAWQDADSRAVAPPSVRTQYERISEWLLTMGADEVFPDAVALLRWRERNQRRLPKLALDGVATRESTEQLIHCLESGEQGAQVVVYGHGVAQPIEISPPLLAAWGGELWGFNINRWVHALSANAAKLMAVLENITKLIRANKFAIDTVLYKVSEDAISDAFSRAADASDSAQVVLIFPTLQEEMQSSGDDGRMEKPKSMAAQSGASAAPQKKEDDEREKLKADWLNLLFTNKSVAAASPEGPLPTTLEAGSKSPNTLVVWVGDSPKSENAVLKDLPSQIGSAALMAISWSQHPAGDGLGEFNLNSPDVTEGTWYLRDRGSFENEDLDLLHDVELLGRSMVESIEGKLAATGLDWKNVIIMGFGKGAGIALYALLLKVIPNAVAGMILFSPIVLFPSFLAEKMTALRRATSGSTMKLFTIWGNRNRSTPGSYRQLLQQALRKASDINSTPDTLPDGDHSFDSKGFNVLTSMLPLLLPR